MMPRTVLLFLLLAACAPLATPRAHAQQGGEPDVTGVVQGEGFTRIRLAVPGAEAAANAASAAREITDALRADLDFSGYFEIVDPALYPLAATSTEKTAREKWLSVGAAALCVNRVSLSGDRIELRAQLHDTQHGALLFDRRYGGAADLARRLAHQLADDIVKHFTGRPGVALTRISFTSRFGKGKEIYLMDYDGQRVRRLTTTNTINITPAWSPDGERLAFVSWRDGKPGIYFLDSNGKLARVPTNAAQLNSSPDWSPDGRRIVYTSIADGNAEIFLLDLAAGTNRRLTRSPAIDTSPAWSPNGREIAFTSDRGGSPQIYTRDVDGGNVRRVSLEGTYNDSAAWSPRGDKLLYASRLEGKFQIVVLDIATQSLRQITRAGNNENPRWSPDGRHIVFASDRAGSYDIYTMRADGTGARRLTQAGDAWTPDWSRRP
jgi:TolB protein